MIVMPTAPLRNNGTVSVYTKKIFSDEECDNILTSIDPKKWEEGLVGGHKGKGKFSREKEIRSNYQQPIPIDAEGFPLNHIAQEISAANSILWRFDLEGYVEDDMPWIMDYRRIGDHNDWHIDLGQSTASSRKLGFSLQLTEGVTYKGGDLGFHRLEKNRNELTSKGTLIVFPAFWLHKVSQMIAGERKVVVGWIHGPSFR